MIDGHASVGPSVVRWLGLIRLIVKPFHGTALLAVVPDQEPDRLQLSVPGWLGFVDRPHSKQTAACRSQRQLAPTGIVSVAYHVDWQVGSVHRRWPSHSRPGQPDLIWLVTQDQREKLAGFYKIRRHD